MTTQFVVSSRQRPPVVAPVWKAAPPNVKRGAKSIERVVIEAMRTLADSSDADRVRRGLRIRSVPMVMQGLDWIGFMDSLGRVSKYLGQTTKAFAKTEIPRTVRKADGDLPSTVSVTLAFDLIDQLALAYSERHAGQLVARVSADVRRNVQLYTTSALNGALTVDQLARRLRDFIPLTAGDAALVEKFEQRQFLRIIQEGETLERAAATASDLAARLATRKLNDRAENIARTELAIAANEGRYAGWTAGVDAGMFQRDSLKQWVAADTACDQCSALDGEIARWDGTFPNGLEMPPDHPSCRCSAVILPPDDDIVAEMERQFDQRANIDQSGMQQ